MATDDAATDARMHALAKAAGVLTNVAAHPELCDFQLPSIVDRDPVTIAISTGGASPILARRLRAKLQAAIPRGMAASPIPCVRGDRGWPCGSPTGLLANAFGSGCSMDRWPNSPSSATRRAPKRG